MYVQLHITKIRFNLEKINVSVTYYIKKKVEIKS